MRALTVDDRLDAIAGKPAGLLTAPGQSGALSGFTPLGGRSVYTVYDVTGTATNFPSIAQLGDYSGDGVIGISGYPTTTDLAWQVRFDTSGGSKNKTLRPPNSGKLGRRVTVGILADGATSALAQCLDEAAVTTSIMPGAGQITPANLVLFPGGEAFGMTGLIAAAYPAAHTAWQRTMIMRKLLSLSLSLSP